MEPGGEGALEGPPKLQAGAARRHDESLKLGMNPQFYRDSAAAAARMRRATLSIAEGHARDHSYFLYEGLNEAQKLDRQKQALFTMLTCRELRALLDELEGRVQPKYLTDKPFVTSPPTAPGQKCPPKAPPRRHPSEKKAQKRTRPTSLEDEEDKVPPRRPQTQQPMPPPMQFSQYYHAPLMALQHPQQMQAMMESEERWGNKWRKEQHGNPPNNFYHDAYSAGGHPMGQDARDSAVDIIDLDDDINNNGMGMKDKNHGGNQAPREELGTVFSSYFALMDYNSGADTPRSVGGNNTDYATGRNEKVPQRRPQEQQPMPPPMQFSQYYHAPLMALQHPQQMQAMMESEERWGAMGMKDKNHCGNQAPKEELGSVFSSYSPLMDYNSVADAPRSVGGNNTDYATGRNEKVPQRRPQEQQPMPPPMQFSQYYHAPLMALQHPQQMQAMMESEERWGNKWRKDRQNGAEQHGNPDGNRRPEDTGAPRGSGQGQGALSQQHQEFPAARQLEDKGDEGSRRMPHPFGGAMDAAPSTSNIRSIFSGLGVVGGRGPISHVESQYLMADFESAFNDPDLA